MENLLEGVTAYFNTLTEVVVPALVEALQCPHFVVRDNALKALAKLGPLAMPALPQVLKLLPRTHAAGDVVRKIGQPAFPFLLAASHDPDPVVRKNMLSQLAWLGCFLPTLARLVDALQDQDPSIRYCAAERLLMTMEFQAWKNDEIMWSSHRGQFLHEFESWFPVIPDPKLRLKMIHNLALSPNAIFFDQLRAALHDDSAMIRWEALKALATFRRSSYRSQAVMILASALQSKDWVVRMNAAKVLCVFGPSVGLSWYTPPDEASVILAKGRRIPSYTMGCLLRALCDEHEAVRVRSLRAVGAIAPSEPETRVALLEMLQDRSRIVRDAAARTISKIGRIVPVDRLK